jgi:hypothetical protein
LHESVFQGEQGRADPWGDLKLRVDVLDVVAHGLGGSNPSAPTDVVNLARDE